MIDYMTTAATEACAVGCRRRGEHFASCEAYGAEPGAFPCRGCVPREAIGESLVCGRCFHLTRALLIAAPEMLAHVHAIRQPVRAVRYDNPGGGGSGRAGASRAPTHVDMLDAADFITTLLWATREAVEGRHPVGRVPVPLRATPESLRRWAQEQIDVIEPALSRFSTTPPIVQLVKAVKSEPTDRDAWTLLKIARRWSTSEPPYWAAQPCPRCAIRAVKVTPPGHAGDDTTYSCTGCHWESTDTDDPIWGEVFTKRAEVA